MRLTLTQPCYRPALLLVLVLAGLLGGCGQKGPLYLPDAGTSEQQ
ncbi:hypothetical protein TspCOW1_24310 [Thiohalobacter sp. COW1]|uniref:Lipoprotein n=1 Tax=Thiohalobacter thiocyanaticus TaxID=585455 RepID=A0A1Z4VMI1_9GAMM|nr:MULTISPECIES: lipoprotein [Thiohalobacter]BAZ92713.1 lipoprotein [Thiohalobacter thiocyanaticus]BCO32328.1 hypothetical protein TspCOW1_24310 [Thiohalobacter sp. COW1]